MTVTLVQRVAAGGKAQYPELPAFCQVAATLRPTSDSEIRIEVWMPEGTAWNGKYEGTGNGGWGGAIEPGELAAGVRRGYATASTDTGHEGASASFAMGHPEKLVDFGYRSVHGMTIAAKALIAAYYGLGAKLAYFEGCSSGGRQALMEAQRYPEDYDGIVAGSATNNFTKMMFGRIWVGQATLSEATSYIPPAKYPMIHRAVLEACDAMDGVKDGVLNEPMKCRFDPGVGSVVKLNTCDVAWHFFNLSRRSGGIKRTGCDFTTSVPSFECGRNTFLQLVGNVGRKKFRSRSARTDDPFPTDWKGMESGPVCRGIGRFKGIFVGSGKRQRRKAKHSVCLRGSYSAGGHA
jgi:hypothetical protein